MTEQLDRELTTMFHDRAERLDVLPPLPASSVRRARVQSALAIASVLAVLAAGGVVGVRLASSAGDAGGLSVAAGGSPRAALERVAKAMLAGRWHMTLSTRDGATGPAVLAVEADFDGSTRSGIARMNGQIVAIQVDGVSYSPLSPSEPYADLMRSKGARWVRQPTASFGFDPALAVVGSSGSGRASVTTDSRGGTSTSRRYARPLADQDVSRTRQGFRVEAKDQDQTSRSDIVIRTDGSVASVHTVTTQRVSVGPKAGTTESVVTDVVYTPLAAPVHVKVPDPSTVVTQAQMEAALRAWETHASQQCSSSFMTPSPPTTTTRSLNGTTVTTQQSQQMLSCAMHLVGPPPAVTVTVAPH